MKKVKMALLAVAAIIGTGSAYATHTKTVATPPCSEIAENFTCENAVEAIHCCKDDLTGATIYGPLVENPAK